MSDERTRSEEPEPEPNLTEGIYEHYSGVRHRINKPYVVKGSERPWEMSRQGSVKIYSCMAYDDAVLPDWTVFREEIPDESGRHTHQGGLGLFGTKGKGATYVDGEMIEWEEGDLVMLPIKPLGLTHQHYNRQGPDDPAEFLAFIFTPHFEHLGAEFTQQEVAKDWESSHGEVINNQYHDHSPKERLSELFSDFDYQNWVDYEPPEETETLYDDLIVERNQFRKLMGKAQDAGNWEKIEAGQPGWEWNPQGKVKWYLHPSLETRPIRNMLYSVQEIPPGSRSGKQHRQGGITHYVLDGEGHSVIDGERWEWEAGDYLGLPVKPEGMEVQHFNASTDEPAQFIRCEINMSWQLGYDMGCGFKQLEACPEYDGELPE